MTLVHDWKWVARKAWSIRLGIISGLFSAAEVVLPLVEQTIPHGVFAGLSGLVAMGAVVSRLVAQDRG